MYDRDPVSFHIRATSLGEVIEQQQFPRRRPLLTSVGLSAQLQYTSRYSGHDRGNHVGLRARSWSILI